MALFGVVLIVVFVAACWLIGAPSPQLEDTDWWKRIYQDSEGNRYELIYLSSSSAFLARRIDGAFLGLGDLEYMNREEWRVRLQGLERVK